jgi:hypothetical protein
MPKQPKINAVRVGLNTANGSTSYLLLKGNNFEVSDTINITYGNISWSGTASTFSNGTSTYIYVALIASNPGNQVIKDLPGDMDEVSITATNNDGQKSEAFTPQVEIYNQP